MLKIGTMVGLAYYNRNMVQPIGVVVGNDGAIFNDVKWINGESHQQNHGKYLTDSLEVLSEVD